MRIFAYALAAVVVAGMVLAAIPMDLVSASHLIEPAALSLAGCVPLVGSLRGTTALSPIVMAAKSIEEMEADLADLIADSQSILDLADEEDRDTTDEENTKIDENKVKAESLKRKIEARRSIADLAPAPAQGRGRQSAAEVVNQNGNPGTRRTVPAAGRDSQRHGFVSMGEFAQAVRAHKLGDFESDGVKKLLNAATTYGNEGAGADGAHLVPPDFSRSIWQKVGEVDENLMARCTELTPSGNSMTLPKDETAPWGTSGIQAYWEAEGAAATGTKGVFESSTLRLFKLMALAPVTEELLDDATGFQSWINAKVPAIIAHKINTAIISGTGAGQPQGILNAPSLVSVAKETSQPADTVWFANINKMWSRMYAPWRRNAVWLINQDIEPSLHGMAFQATGASSMLPGTSAVPAYLPMNGLSGSPYATLMGRPVIPLQACKTVGDQGDIILADLKQYWILRKAQGLQTDTSMHLYFDQAITAFRFIFRVNGQAAWSAAITPENGSNTLSWAVVLDAR